MNTAFAPQAPSSPWKSAPVAAAAIVTLFAIAAAIGNALARDVPTEPTPAAVTTDVITSSPADAPAYSVFVDEETRFAFIRLASGQWKFVRQLDAGQMRQLPPTTYVAARRTDVETVAAATASTEVR